MPYPPSHFTNESSRELLKLIIVGGMAMVSLSNNTQMSVRVDGMDLKIRR